MIPMKRLKDFFKTKSNWTSVFTFVLAFIAFCISFFKKEFSYLVIASMFFLIAIENFIERIVFVENIKDKLDSLKKQDLEGIKIIKSNYFVGEINEFFHKSQKEFILIGGSLLKFAGSVDSIINHSNDKAVKFRILALNIENDEIRTQYKKMLNRENIPSNLDHLKELKNKRNIEIRTYEFLPTAYYFANDLNHPNGIIRAAHIFYGVTEEFKYPHILVDGSDSYWYKAYRNQIESLWKRGTRWL